MSKLIRLVMILAILAGIVYMVGQRGVWAAPQPPIDVTGDPKTGAGPYKLGGCVTGVVKDIKPEYKMNVALLEAWNAYRTEGLPPMPIYYWTLPGGPDDIFSCVAVVRIMHKDKLLKEFPVYEQDQYSKDYPFVKGSAEICLDTPTEKEGSIFFYDEFRWFYNKEIHGDNYPNWQYVAGPFPAGSKGCVPVTYSGVYAYYVAETDKQLGPDKVDITRFTTRIGTVDVPGITMSIKKNGAMAVGGCATGNVEDLVENKGYKVIVKQVGSLNDVDVLPQKVGKLYECVVDVKFYQNDQLINELPKDDGNVLVCFAIPPFQDGTMYYLDVHFDKLAKWKPISEPYKTGIACGPVMKSGYYGMVDVQK